MILVLGSHGVAVAPEIVAAVNIAAAAVITLIAYQPPTLNPGDTLNVTTPAGHPTAVTTVAVPPSVPLKSLNRRIQVADTLDTLTRPTALLKVDGRDPFADEAITVSDPAILSVALQGDGTTLVTALADGVATITVATGSEDVNRTAGSDDVTVATTAPATPLVVTLA